MKRSKPRSAQLAFVQNLPHNLAFGLRGGHSTLILDVRLRSSFTPSALGLADAVPIFFDDTPVQLPDLERDHPIMVYCDSEQQASSHQIAAWLIALGYLHVWVMDGGLAAWNQARSRSVPVTTDGRAAIEKWIAAPATS